MAEQEGAAPGNEGTQETDNQPTQQEPRTESSRTADGGEESTDWKAMARKWEKEAKAKSAAAAKAEADAQRLREATQTDAEKALEAARREGAKNAEAEWKAKWITERGTNAALRAMNGRVADPRLAMPLLDLKEVVDDKGEVDKDALAKAVDDLLEEYPALAAGGAPTTHHGDLGPKSTQRLPQDMNALLRRAAGR